MNSRHLLKDQLYFFIMYATNTAQARDLPWTEWMRQLSPAYMAYSTKEKMAFTALFFLSKI
jgi:hypothetical protein